MNISKIFLSVLALVLFAGAATAQDPVPLYPDNYKVVLENQRVRVLDFQLKKGAKEDFHAHPAAVTYVLIAVQDSLHVSRWQYASSRSQSGRRLLW